MVCVCACAHKPTGQLVIFIIKYHNGTQLTEGKLLDGAVLAPNNKSFACHSTEVGILVKQKQTQAEMNSNFVCHPEKTQEMKGAGEINESKLI